MITFHIDKNIDWSGVTEETVNQLLPYLDKENKKIFLEKWEEYKKSKECK